MIFALLSGWLVVMTMAAPISEKSQKIQKTIIPPINNPTIRSKSLQRKVRDSIGQNRLGNNVHLRKLSQQEKHAISHDYQFVRHFLSKKLSSKVFHELRKMHKKTSHRLQKRTGGRKLSRRGSWYVKVQQR